MTHYPLLKWDENNEIDIQLKISFNYNHFKDLVRISKIAKYLFMKQWE